MQGLRRIRFFGLQIRFYLLFYLCICCLFRIALKLCNYRAIFTYQVKLRNSATSLIIIYKFSNCILIGCQKTVFYSLIFHIGFARRLRPSPRFHSQHFKLIHCIFFSQAIQERYRNLTWSATYPCELQQDDLRLYTA